MARRWLALSGLLACAGPPPGPGAAGVSEQGPAPRRPSSEAPALHSAPDGSCAASVRLDGAGASAVLGLGAADGPAADGAVATGLACAVQAGAPRAFFELDLSTAAQPVPVQVVLDAPFAFEVALARGPCGDLRAEQCGTPLYADERSRVIAATLAPDRYRLIVSAAPGTASAEVHASATIGELRCAEPPANDACTQAQPVDTRLAVQSLSGTLACARPGLQVRCANFEAADVFYELDLSDRLGETLLDVAVAAPENRAVSATLLEPSSNEACGETWMCGAQFSARLLPGKYRLALSESATPGGVSHPTLPASPPGSPSPFALRIQLSEPDCSDSNDTWQTALELDPTVERQRIAGNTACGSNQIDTACFADRGAPELFYRLDLRAAPGPKTLQTHDLLGDDTVSYLLQAEGDDSPPQVVACTGRNAYESQYELAPRLYYLVIDGMVRNAGRFDLQLELSDSPTSVPCATDKISQCLTDSEPACADSLVTPRCLTVAVECGLAPSVLDAFCGVAPDCCTGAAAPTSCLDAWAAAAQCG